MPRTLAGHRSRTRSGAVADPAAERRDRAPVAVPAHGAGEPDPPGPPADDRAPASPPRRRPDPRLLVAALVVVVLAVTAGLLAVRARAEERLERARTAALAAAESHAVVLLSYDHRTLDRDFARARTVLTGPFAEDYATTTEEVVRPSAEQVKAVVTAEVAASSVVRASADRVVVLLFVDQTTTSTRLDGPKIDLNRVRMTLQRVGQEWRVSAVDAL